MRKKIAQQLPLTPGFADHEHGRELAAISAILDAQPDLLDDVAIDLNRHGVRSGTTGRPGMTAEQVLRALLLKQMHELSYEELSFHLADSASFQTFCRIATWDRPPSRSTLAGNIKQLRPATLEEIHRQLVGFAAEAGVEDGQQARFDCTVTTSNIHKPFDSQLLWDTVRVLTRLLERARKHFGADYADRTLRAKRRALEIRNAKTKKQRGRLYRDLLVVAKETIESARRVAEDLEGDCLREQSAAEHLALEMKRSSAFGMRVVDQAHRRVILGESVPATEKIVSIFEDHTDIIIKDNRDTYYGHKLSLAVGRSSFVLDCVVLDGNPADSTLAVPMVLRQLGLYGRVPRQVAFDGGFTSASNLQTLKAMGVEDVMFHKKRGIEVEEMTKSAWVYRRLRNFRAGVEGVISFLKRCFGLRRCTWRGHESFKAYVWSSVITANLLVLARARLNAQV